MRIWLYCSNWHEQGPHDLKAYLYTGGVLNRGPMWQVNRAIIHLFGWKALGTARAFTVAAHLSDICRL